MEEVYTSKSLVEGGELNFLKSSLQTNSHLSGVVLFLSNQCHKVLLHRGPGG